MIDWPCHAKVVDKCFVHLAVWRLVIVDLLAHWCRNKQQAYLFAFFPLGLREVGEVFPTNSICRCVLTHG